jgi:nucleolar protein 9
MPKEHVRKRGKRRPKEDGAFDAPSAPADRFEDGTSANAAVVAAEEAHAAAASGIHASRLAFLKTGVRPAPEPTPRAEGDGAEGDGAEGDGAEGAEGGADWTRLDRSDSEFPFGVLDPDVKAYFRNVEEQVRAWEGRGVDGDGEEREGEFVLGARSGGGGGGVEMGRWESGDGVLLGVQV